MHLVNIPYLTQSHIFFLVVRNFRSYSYSFQIYNTVVLTIVTTL